MGKLTLEELRKLREKARKNVYLRDSSFRGKVIVHMGTCGIAAGAREILKAFLEEAEKREITDIQITTSGCAGLCSKEPMATVELEGHPPIKYGPLTKEKVKAIVEKHILEGEAIKEYAIGAGSERGG